MPSPLDPILPRHDIFEHHSAAAKASPEHLFATACRLEMDQVWLARAIFRARELLFGSKPADPSLPRGFLDQTRALGWGTLAETPGREIVMGAVTQPWLADVRFRALPSVGEFAAFAEPGFVKIAWAIWVDPAAPDGRAMLHTETRALATDAAARARFRSYWRLVSPGIRLIRRAMLWTIRRQAEAHPEPVSRVTQRTAP